MDIITDTSITPILSSDDVIESIANTPHDELQVMMDEVQAHHNGALIHDGDLSITGTLSAGEIVPSVPMTIPILMVSQSGGGIIPTLWSNMPAAKTEFFGVTYLRSQVDLTAFTYGRILSNIAVSGHSTPAKLRVEYSIDSGSSWDYLDDSSAPSVDIDSTGLKVSGWIPLATNTKADVMLRIVGIDGDGVVDPEFGNTYIQFK